MCGLSGIYHFNGHPVDTKALKRMTQVQCHRGPDDHGYHLFSLRLPHSMPFVEDNDHAVSETETLEGGLGFNRLSILDLSSNGHQPMSSPDGRLCITLNGEIYNAFEYKDELKSFGYHFRSNTDTEVALYLYDRYGLDGMLDRLNGMFAIALFDLNAGELILIRDRLGIKPLYYYKTDNLLLFGSEIKGILQHPAFQAELDVRGFNEYLVFRYCAGGGTLFSGVCQLLPGHWMRVRPDGAKVSRYWDIPRRPVTDGRTLQEQLDGLENCLERSVKRQLLSDVKVGCQLSGGIDSSLISLLASKQNKEGIDYFSVVFDDPIFSEERWIDDAARVAEGQAYKFPFYSEYFFNNLANATWHLDQPLNHPNSIGILLLAEHARSHITVFLSGEGADELFGGYTRFLYARLRSWMTPMSGLLAALPRIGTRLRRRYHDTRSLDDATWFILQSAFMSPQWLQTIQPEGDVNRVLARRRTLFDGTDDYVSNCLRYEMRTYLVDLLIRQDKMTMAHSMENRVPFLDHEVVEYVCGLPIDSLVRLSPLHPVRTGGTKRILKGLAERYFSREFVYRIKSGFPLPLKGYFKDPRFVPVMEEIILPGIRRRGLLNAGSIEKLWSNIDTLDSNSQEVLWIVSAFELWAQQFLEKNHVDKIHGRCEKAGSIHGVGTGS